MSIPDIPHPRVKKILIIEDDEMIAGIYKRKFELAGFKVQVETNGSAGYYHIFKAPPDAVLLDLMLPGMNGPDIIRKFRAQRNFSQLPIIAFTNAYLTEVSRDAVRAGANQVFNKATVMPQEIVSAIVNALDHPGPVEVPAASSPLPGLEPEPKPQRPLLGMLGESPFSTDNPRKPEPLPPLKLTETASPVPRRLSPLVAVQDFGGSTPKREEASSPQPPPEEEKDLDMTASLQAMTGEFVQQSGLWIQGMRSILRQLQADAQRAPRGELFVDIARVADLISSNAAVIGFSHLAQIAAALGALAWELFDHPKRCGASTLQTIAKSVDMIARLADCGAARQLKESCQYLVLVLDDEPIARQMIGKVMDRAKLPHLVIGRPDLAMELLAENTFDLFILDVKMEGTSGFDVCTALRKMPRHKHCRVIFVSGEGDLQSKMNSIKVGGNEFVVKPFAPMELALKALLHMVGSRLEKESEGAG